jgi:glycine cleavage system H protein
LAVPEELQYTKTHEWVRREEDVATVGITEHAQDELGDVVFIELPERAPRSGRVTPSVPSSRSRPSPTCTRRWGRGRRGNEALNDAPEKINEEPYGDGWIIRLRVSEEADLLSAGDYEKVLEEEE